MSQKMVKKVIQKLVILGVITGSITGYCVELTSGTVGERGNSNSTYEKPMSYGKASWYSVESCKREGTWAKYGGKTASGEPFKNNAMTCALPQRGFGKWYRVTNLMNGKEVVVRHNDYGPGRIPHSRGVIVDLSKGAFERIAPLYRGIIYISIQEVEE